MRIPRLSALVLASALTTIPVLAFADPTTSSSVEATESLARPAPSDADQYAAREAKDAQVAKFKGGSEVVVIGSTATLLIILLILVIVL